MLSSTPSRLKRIPVLNNFSFILYVRAQDDVNKILPYKRDMLTILSIRKQKH